MSAASIAKLHEMVIELQKGLKEVRGTSNRNTTSINRQEKLLTMVNEHKSIEHLNSLERRILELSQKLQIEILKNTVVSEVPRIYPDSWRFVVKAMDKDDHWWNEGDDLTILQWRDRVILEADV